MFMNNHINYDTQQIAGLIWNVDQKFLGSINRDWPPLIIDSDVKTPASGICKAA